MKDFHSSKPLDQPCYGWEMGPESVRERMRRNDVILQRGRVTVLVIHVCGDFPHAASEFVRSLISGLAESGEDAQ